METEYKKKYIKLQDLEVYKLSRELSKIGWEIYEKMDWQTKKVIGDQFITATDSFGANVAEGYSRFHYLDKIKFFYNSRGSLTEAVHWADLLFERRKISKEQHQSFLKTADLCSIKLQNLISSNYKARDKQ